MIAVRDASPAEIEGWDFLVGRFPNARIVHERAWIRSLEAAGFGRPMFLVIERDGRIVGALPGLVKTVGPLRLFGSPLPGWQTVSMGPGFDARVVSAADFLPPVVHFLERRHGIHYLEFMTADLDAAIMIPLGFHGEPAPTLRAPLYPGDEARTFKCLKDSARRNVKRAERLGLEVRFVEDEAFVEEHFDQVREVYVRGGHTVPFSKRRVLACFRHLKASGNLIAVSAHLPEGGPCIATGTFLIGRGELLLWMWAHRTRYRWYRATELMTWTVMRRALAAGCTSFDLMGRGDFKLKFGARLDGTKVRWMWSRYGWLTRARILAHRLHLWQQGLRGRLARWRLGRVPSDGAPPESGAPSDGANDSRAVATSTTS
jgi:hypothetical protein